MFKLFKKNKYNAHKVELDGHTFASKAEAARYVLLRAMERNGEIKNLVLQPKFTFPMGFSYKPDFLYEQDGRLICEDVKGVKTRDFVMRAKCFRHFYPAYKLMITEGREWVEFGVKKQTEVKDNAD